MKIKYRNFTIEILLLTMIFVAGMFSIPAQAESEEISYLVLLNQSGKASTGFESDVVAAGGEVTVLVDEIGVAYVSSAVPDFKNRLAKIKGVQQVAYAFPAPEREDIMVFPAPQVDGIALSGAALGEGEVWYPLQWGLDSVHAQQAWDAGATGEGVRVAVLDSGIDHDNVDLVDNINQDLSISFLPCYTGMNCNADGFEDWRVTDGYAIVPGLYFNHGTHVAGIIAAAANGNNVVGVAPDAEIIAIKVCTEFDRWCRDEAILPGIVYAANIGADIINMSLGGLLKRNGTKICEEVRDMQENPDIPCGEAISSQQTLLRAYKRALQYAENNNTTVIVAAANDALDGDDGASGENLFFRFSDFPHVLSISAVGPVGSALPALNPKDDTPAEPVAEPDTLAWYSNFGRSIIDFAAPGGNSRLWLDYSDPFGTICAKEGFELPCFFFDLVVSSNLDDSIFFAEGTSMAAPHASGVAAIIVGLNGGDMSPRRLRNAMKRYADDLGTPGHDEVFGDGLVNAGAATQ